MYQLFDAHAELENNEAVKTAASKLLLRCCNGTDRHAGTDTVPLNNNNNNNNNNNHDNVYGAIVMT